MGQWLTCRRYPPFADSWAREIQDTHHIMIDILNACPMHYTFGGKPYLVTVDMLRTYTMQLVFTEFGDDDEAIDFRWVGNIVALHGILARECINTVHTTRLRQAVPDGGWHPIEEILDDPDAWHYDCLIVSFIRGFGPYGQLARRMSAPVSDGLKN